MDLALNDDGNLDEASAVARVPRRCLVVWCGDHMQTPGGLRKTEDAKAFRRKLLRRPIALRGNTDYLQPHMLGSVVLRYLEGTDGSPVNDIRMLIAEGLSSDPMLTDASLATLKMLSQEVVGVFFERFHAPVLRAALAVLWLSLHREKFPLLADNLSSAAGTAGKLRWALFLPSSARVSQVDILNWTPSKRI